MPLFDKIRYPMDDFTEEELQAIEKKYPGEEGKKRVQELREWMAQLNEDQYDK